MDTWHRERRLELVCVALLFLLSRLVIWLGTAITFDLRPIESSWHIIDPLLLRDDLLRSAFYTPAQPPLYNLLLGVVLKLSRDQRWLRAIFTAVYSGLSLGSTLLLYDLLRRMKVRLAPRAIVSAGFALTPAVILYESLPYYTSLVSFLLLLAVWLFARCNERFTRARASTLWGAVAALILVRSLFQLCWPWVPWPRAAR